MTFTEYLAYKAPPGFKDELIHGEIRLSPNAKAEHQEICKRLERLLGGGHLIHVYRVARHYPLRRRRGRTESGRVCPAESPLEPSSQKCLGYPEGVPEVVIEVRSASNSDPELEQKRSIYLFRCPLSGFLGSKPKNKNSQRVHSIRRHDYFQDVLSNCLLKLAGQSR